MSFCIWLCLQYVSAVASINFPIHVISIATGAVTCVITAPFVYSLTSVNSGRWLCASHSDSRIAVYDVSGVTGGGSSGVPAGTCIRSWPAVRHNTGNFSVTALPYEQGLLSCGSRERVCKVWSNDGQLLRVLVCSHICIASLAAVE
jgi:hypothetical protein